MTISAQINRSVQRRNDLVFRPSDFQAFGSEASIKRALKALTAKGALVRLGIGLYAKAKRSLLSGDPIPAKPIEILGPIALKKLGVVIRESQQAREYNSGRTTQVPAGLIVNTGNRRITRKIGFNGRFLDYERA